jgi:hypothetical protein
MNELEAFKSQSDIRAALVPQALEDYKLELPRDFKGADGFSFNDKDPRVSEFRGLAKEWGLTQEQFQQGLALEASRVAFEETAYQEAKGKFVSSLGESGKQRLENINNFVKSKFGDVSADHLMTAIVTKEGVEVIERLIGTHVGSGAGNYGQNGRASGTGVSEEEYSKMSFAQKIELGRR